MRTEIVNTNHNVSFMALKPISRKALKVGGQALADAIPALESKGLNKEIEIIPKRGLLTKIKSLIIFVTNKGSKKGEWFSLSIDPEGLLPVGKRYKTVKGFSQKNIISATENAERLLANREEHLSRSTVTTFPADVTIIKKLFKKLFK